MQGYDRDLLSANASYEQVFTTCLSADLCHLHRTNGETACDVEVMIFHHNEDPADT